MNVVSDEELAEKFKQEHSEQFQVLVRMHLSFVLDLNTNDALKQTWETDFQEISNKVFEVTN